MMRLLERDVAPLFNGALAVVTAVAAAFATYAMPNDLFSGLVAATGLPALVAAAEPPLGTTARLAAVAGVSVLAFLVVWFVLGAIDAAHEEQDEEPDDDDQPEQVENAEWEPQRRLRRADAHPDAPPRQPLLARRELGEPAETAPEGEPDWMNPQPLAEGLEVVDEFKAGRSVDDSQQSGTEEASAAVGAEDPRDPRGWFEPVPAEAQPEFAPEPEPVWPLAGQGVDETAPAEPHIPAAESVEPNVVDDQPISTEALMAKLPLPEDRGESISTLFQRLETGLASVEWPLSEPAEPDAGVTAEPAPHDSVSHQLKDALSDLQRMAARRS